MLKPDLTTTNYIIILVGFEFCFLAGMSREETREALLMIITTYYYTLLQQLLLHCYFHFMLI